MGIGKSTRTCGERLAGAETPQRGAHREGASATPHEAYASPARSGCTRDFGGTHGDRLAGSTEVEQLRARVRLGGIARKAVLAGSGAPRR